MQKLWIQIKDASEQQNVEAYILYGFSDDLLGDIPVTLYCRESKQILNLGHAYDISADAFKILKERFGEENVKMTDRPESKNEQLHKSEVSLTDALSYIEQSLDCVKNSIDWLSEILERLADCVEKTHTGASYFRIGGSIYTE